MSELKNCPFCGGEDLAFIYDEDTGVRLYQVLCRDCECQTSMDYDNKAELIKQWNTRTPALNWRDPKVELPKELKRVTIKITDGRLLQGILTHYTDADPFFMCEGDVDVETETVTAWTYESELLKTIGGE